ncbi:hypothetical protein BIT28_13075 [Photobacterium proteolyticum]|uniref:Anthrax toxin lethal/endema factor N-/C-terminal domain-containing protein n=1 Tax=Photobacterium proteolyticum TaxID=1903952 RepID=A0A1Q9GK67_9GAMM|nr:hypothetical protein [Photobacterium proteolyticum]OLQ74887.1 hypothetical protein BIT28_13075 [Photobacterium proteolyticum]
MNKLVYLSLAVFIMGCNFDSEVNNISRVFSYDANADSCLISSPPGKLGLDPFYRKYCSLYGVPVVSSSSVSDEALAQAWHIANQMIGNHHEYLMSIAEKGIVIAIIGKNENVTDIPEYSDLDPNYWNARARGLGATEERPAVSGAEENILCLTNDRYHGENIFVHEFSHTVHEFGIVENVKSFQSELESLYRDAYNNLRSNSGFEAGKYPEQAYAMENSKEYWAEGVQSYYDVESAYPVTPQELNLVDPRLYQLIEGHLNENYIANITLCPLP